MIIGPKAYYEEHLKGKTPEEIMTKIRGLKQKISHLKKEIEHPQRSKKANLSEQALISRYRQNLTRAKQALVEVGGIYSPSQAELRVEELNTNIPYISKIEFSIGGFFTGFEKRTFTVDGDLIHVDIEHTFDWEFPSQSIEIKKEPFLKNLADLHLGEWRRTYDPIRFGYIVLDGTSWVLKIHFSNGYKSRKFEGSNDFPYNFNKFKKSLGIKG